MKSIPIITCFVTLFFLGNSVNAQSLVVYAAGTYTPLSEFETNFMAGGLGVEGRLGNSFTLAIDGSYAKNVEFRSYQFSSQFRVYPKEPFYGFYIGLGYDLFNLNKLDGTPIGYPLDNRQVSGSTIGGPSLKLGVQTILDESLSLGFQAGFGIIPAAETLVFVQTQFRIGLKL